MEAIPLTPAEHKTLAHFRERFRGGIKKSRNWCLGSMKADYETMNRLATRKKLTNIGGALIEWPEDERMLTDLYYLIIDEEAALKRKVQQGMEIAWQVPTYEQAQVLNCWHPDYDPTEAPRGYQSICDFSGKRVGKSWGLVWNGVLWIIPNDPDWVFFDEHEDHMGRGKYRVLPRFSWDEWKRSGRRIYDRDEPPKSGANCVIWVGCVDENHWNLKVEPKFRKFMPDQYIARKGKDKQWFKADKYFVSKFGHSVVAKLYNSEASTWSGDEVFATLCDEGPTKDKVDEAISRSEYFHVAYTPNEPANTAEKAALARAMYDGDDDTNGGQPLVGKKKFFFSEWDNLPEYVASEEKKKQRIATLSKLGVAGEAARRGGFFDSSPKVFNLFNPEVNILPVDGPMIVRAIRGESYPDEREEFPWLERFFQANIIRGFDEGLAHPTAAVWGCLLKTGEKVVYRDLERTDSSIRDRVEQIVDMSGNRLSEIYFGPDMSKDDYEAALEFANELQRDRARESATRTRVVRMREIFVREPIRRTFGDSKLFKRDPACPFDTWGDNYQREGLVLERAVNIGPAERCDYVNGLFRLDKTRKHLNPEQGGEHGYGAALYITNDCATLRMRVEKYLQEQFRSGPRMGQFTGKPAQTGDDLIDGLAYFSCPKLSWIDPDQYAKQSHLPKERAA